MQGKITATLIFAMLALTAGAQDNLEDFLTQVEQNNTTLAAFRKEVEAEKMGNRTGILPQNPTAEVYFLRETGEPGRRTDFNVAQPFDFPTVYGLRNRLANSRNQQLESRYHEFRKKVLLRTHELFIDMVYFNALEQELELRLEHANAISRAYEVMFETGQTNVLELNKARINQINARQALSQTQIEKQARQAEITSLNGGKQVLIIDTGFGIAQLPDDFNQWFNQVSERNPSFIRLNQQLEISHTQEKLTFAENLPRFAAGFMRESLPGETFQGFGLSATIPLWENRNTMKHAKLRTMAAQSHKADALLFMQNRLRSLYNQAAGLKAAASDYNQVLQNLNNSQLLNNALEAGEISLIEYLMELSFYYQAVNNALDTQRNLHKTLAAMRHFTL